MLLIRISAWTVFFLSVLCSFVGCSISHDADEVAARRVSGQRADPSVGEYSFLGLQRDHSPDLKRIQRAEHLIGDPRLVPSVKEQRIARAKVRAQERAVREAGLVFHRWDGSASQPSEVSYASSPGALKVNYQASEKLNSVDSEPHALLAVIYHLSDRAALDQLSKHEDGMRKLLEGEKFDESVLRVKKHYVQPGAKGQLLFDRPEGGRFVAVVAGYAHPAAETSLYVGEYGLGHWVKKVQIFSRISRYQDMYTPLPLSVAIRFGESEMAVKNIGELFDRFEKTQELSDTQLWHFTLDELGWSDRLDFP